MPTITINNNYDAWAQYDICNATYQKIENDSVFHFGYYKAYQCAEYRSRAAIRFPLDSLPAGANVTLVRLKVKILRGGGSVHLTDVHPYNGDGQADPDPDDAQTFYSRTASGTPYIDDTTAFRTSGIKWFDLGAQACIDVENAKAAVNRFSIGLHEEGDNDDEAVCEGRLTPNAVQPQLEITYEEAAPPAVGYSYSDGLVCVQVGG